MYGPTDMIKSYNYVLDAFIVITWDMAAKKIKLFPHSRNLNYDIYFLGKYLSWNSKT
jgi:hypothetical protein